MAEDLGERTEAPTARRRSQARDRGQVAKSQDLSGSVDLLGGFLLLLAMGGVIAEACARMVASVLGDSAPGDALDASQARETIAHALERVGGAALPVFVGVALVACAAQIVQVGWSPTTYPLIPKVDRLNPVAGFKRVVGMRSLVKLPVNTLKLTVLALVGAAVIASNAREIVALPAIGLLAAVAEVLRIVKDLALWLLVLFVVIGVIDWVYQRWQHTRDLRMTKHDVKEERRSMEGDPEMKARRLRFAQEIAMHRIQRDVPSADVVVANPTHFSVALKYDADEMRAPRVVAKGADHLALRIREVAGAHGVPVVHRPPLARALYWNVDVGREIPAEHYEAVAEVLAYVYRLKAKAA